MRLPNKTGMGRPTLTREGPFWVLVAQLSGRTVSMYVQHDEVQDFDDVVIKVRAQDGEEFTALPDDEYAALEDDVPESVAAFSELGVTAVVARLVAAWTGLIEEVSPSP